MPEGHSVHRLARQLDDVFAGRRLRVCSPQGRFAAGAALLDGREFLTAEAHGKQLFAHFEAGRVLRVHLGLYGAFSFGGDETFRGPPASARRVGSGSGRRTTTVLMWGMRAHRSRRTKSGPVWSPSTDGPISAAPRPARC